MWHASEPVPALGRRRWLQALCAAAAATAAPRWLAAAADGADRVSLALNENPFGPSALALQAIQASLQGLSRYTSADAAALVDQIAEREQVKPEQILLGEVLEALGSFLARPAPAGGEFLYSVPGYTALVEAAEAASGKAVPIALDAELRNDLPALRARLGPRTRAVFLVNPHNPSGTVNDAAALHAFARAVPSNVVLVADEAYLEFTPDFAERSLVQHVRSGARVVVFRTFSKFYGLAALPLGYALLPADLAGALHRQGIGGARSLNRLAVVAAAASLKDGSYTERVRAAVARERGAWAAELQSLGLRHSASVGNFVFFETGRPHAQVAAAFAAQGIDIGRAFPPLERWARISIGLPAENARARAALRGLIKH
jgi:histidinol-phosphate aminotransferase